jgi:DNA topoisomerase-3
MAKSLIITEKPSVARDVVAALGGFKAMAGQAYWESDQYVCTYAVGHLVSLLEPEDLDPRFKTWSLATLPIIPQQFQWKPIPGQERRLAVIKDLMARPDVRTLVNACDAAREGELIFRELVRFFECRKWVQRLWLQSMTPEAIRAGFARLRDGTDLDGLGDAAECRAKADWLIGMNATRAFSKRLRTPTDTAPWSVGRVQTPTLALLVGRELEILAHEPKPFFRVTARFAAPDHEYEGTWFDPAFKKQELKPELKDDRIDDEAKAKAVMERVEGQPGVAAETREESLRHAPPLFNLTALQKHMAQRFKWSSKRTLEAAQRCYEQHKVLTYPRTSSSCLPSDYRGEVRRLIEALAGVEPYGESAQRLLRDGLRNEKRTFDDAGVSDHFAIIPTGKLRAPGGDDGRLFDAVVRRFLATFHPPAVYDKVRRTTVVAGESFRTGPLETLVVPGWLAVMDKGPDAPDDAKRLPPLAPGRKNASGVGVRTLSVTSKSEMTRPPPRINEAGLLSLMEHAGRQVEDEELATALMSAEGLGTAATRADIIQNLKAKLYVDDALRPTVKGIHLVTMLRRIDAARLTSAELTAQLELEMAEVEKGSRPAQRFMAEIERYVTEVVGIAKTFTMEAVFPDADPVGGCPRCGKPVYERALTYECGCGFRVWKDVHGRYLDRTTAATLLRDGSTRELDGFKSRSGKDFKARLEIRDGVVRIAATTADGEARSAPVAAPEAPEGGRGGGRGPARGRQGASAKGEASRERDVIAPCPVHPPPERCNVVETANAYVCETRLEAFKAGDSNPKGVLLSKTIARRPLSRAEAQHLLTKGSTPELKGFVSKAGKPFNAKLRLGADGRAEFEFVPRGAQSGGRSAWSRGRRSEPDSTGDDE